MTDEGDRIDGVDELLSDLDVALAVEPSPAVAARVRTRVDERSGWRPRLWPLAVATSFAMAVGAYALWPGTSSPSNPTPEARSVLPSHAARTVPASVRPEEGRTPVAATRNASRSRSKHVPAARAVAAREPEVIVSPEVAVAFAGLQAAALEGRLTADFFTRPPAAIVSPLRIEVESLEIDVVPPAAEPAVSGPAGPGTVETGADRTWPARLFSRTRSSS